MFSLCPLATQTLVPNPLSATHNFMQACSICFAREGGWVGTMPICPTLHCSLVYNVFTATNVSKSCQRHCTLLFYFYFFSGPATYTFIHKPDLDHSCKRDILLCRRKGVFPSEWTKVRHPPSWTSITGPFVLCKRDYDQSSMIHFVTFPYNFI